MKTRRVDRLQSSSFQRYMPGQEKYYNHETSIIINQQIVLANVLPTEEKPKAVPARDPYKGHRMDTRV